DMSIEQQESADQVGPVPEQTGANGSQDAPAIGESTTKVQTDRGSLVAGNFPDAFADTLSVPGRGTWSTVGRLVLGYLKECFSQVARLSERNAGLGDRLAEEQRKRAIAETKLQEYVRVKPLHEVVLIIAAFLLLLSLESFHGDNDKMGWALLAAAL